MRLIAVVSGKWCPASQISVTCCRWRFCSTPSWLAVVSWQRGSS